MHYHTNTLATLITLSIISCHVQEKNTTLSQADSTNAQHSDSLLPQQTFIDSLMNGKYYNSESFGSGEDAPFRLHNGRCLIKPFDVYSSDSSYVDAQILSTPTMYDFDHDGKIDALVLLDENFGGSGCFISINIMLNRNGTPVFTATKTLGDRIQIDSIKVIKDTISVYSVVHGPNDPMAWVTMPYVFKLIFQNKSLAFVDGTDPYK